MRWELSNTDVEATQTLQRELGLSRLPAAVLAARGLVSPEAADAFLKPDLASIPDPFLLRGMDAAVDRIIRAIEQREKVAVYADYDVDGCTSATLLCGALRELGLIVEAYVPHRLVEGYGLNPTALDTLAGRGARLVITADCGVTNVSEVDHAARIGLDVIVLDHHRAAAELPRAVAVVNPHQPGCNYPDKGLAAVGVSFLMLAALRRRCKERGLPTIANLRQGLDLVALGTVADVAPLSGVNRVLVHHGLLVLAERRRPGIRALCDVAGLSDGPLTAGQIGFKLGPRINAAGRLDDASVAVELLTTTDEGRARTLAALLDVANTERQTIEAQMREEAFLLAEPLHKSGAMGLVLASEGWHPGVVGIVASRVAERFRRPAVLLALEEGTARGSARSVEGFHLYDALKACGDHLTRFGGHRQAAGLSMVADSLPAFRAAFEAHADKAVNRDLLEPRCRIDAIADHGELTTEVAAELARLAPFGIGNPEPILIARGLRSPRRRVLPARMPGGAGHLKLRFDSGLEAIGFGMAERDAEMSGSFDAAFSLEVSEWGGRTRPEMKLRDVRVAERVA